MSRSAELALPQELADLFAAAVEARSRSHAPYSRFHVGAAIRTPSGRIFPGCNVENAAYPVSNCAEASAVTAMVMGGEKRIAEILVIGPTADFCAPCGGCRQRIREFASAETRIHLATGDGSAVKSFSMDELLPMSFGPEDLERSAG